MNLFNRIVVPVDGSEPSDEAVNLALRLAENNSTEISFCSIVESDRIAAECASVGGDPSPIVEELIVEAQQLVTSASRKAEAAGITSKMRIHHAEDPVEGILSVALTAGADLIVMGSHGRRGLSRLVMGSTTEGVLRRSDIPVLVVREPRAQTRPAERATPVLARA